jgi:hypothetical protein
MSEAFDRARVGCVLRKRSVSSHVIIIDGKFPKNSPKVLLVDHDQMISCPYSKLRKPKKSWSFSGIQSFE